MLAFFQNLYLPDFSDRKEPTASPLLAPELASLPPALIIAAGKDLMKTDSSRYAERLKLAGVQVIYKEFENADHGFTHNGPIQAAHEAFQLISTTLIKSFDYGKK